MAVSRINEAGLNVNQYGNRNIIINGGMKVSQRGTSSTGLGTTAGYYTVDRYNIAVGGTATAGRFTMTQESDGPSALSGLANSIKLACTTADTSIAAGENMRIVHVIEGQDLQRLKKGTSSAESFTISFYVKGNAAATYICEVYDLDNTRHVGKTFNVTTDWNRIELTFPADTTGAIADDATGGIQITFWLHSGTTNTSGTLPATWAAVSNANRAGGLSTSFYDSTSRTFFLSGLQMEVGDTATDFEHRSYGDELARCQRYYYQHSNTGNATRLLPGSAISYSSSFIMLSVQFPVQMRGTPSLVETTGTNYLRYFHTNASTNFDGFGALQEASFVGANVYNSSSISGLTAGNVGWVRMVDALYRLGFDAEL